MRSREFIFENDLSNTTFRSWAGYLQNMISPGMTVSIGAQGQKDKGLILSGRSKKKIENLISAIESGEMDTKDLAKIIKNTELTFNNSKKTYLIKQVYKSKEIRGEEKFNKGEVSEGYHAVAAFARLIKRPTVAIVVDDVINIINQLQNGQTLVLKKPEVDSDIADEFHLTVKLKPLSWTFFKDIKTINRMPTIVNSIISDANAETSRYADRYATNKKYDLVRVLADGVSGETVRKTDVSFENTTEKKFVGYSIKTGTTSQIGQVGGGGSNITAEEQFDILQNKLFNVEGKFPLANISNIKSEFIRARSNEKRQQIAYLEAAASLNNNLMTDTKEKIFLKNLVGALKYWAAKDDPNVKLKQFTETGTLILDINKIDRLIDDNKLDLYADYDDTKTYASIFIADSRSGKKLITIRTKVEGTGYIRNYIEKGELFNELTMTRFIPNAPRITPDKQPSVQPQPVPQTPQAPQPAQPTTPAPAGQFNNNVALEVSKIPMKSK